MAFCINCGQELAEGAKFCASCGNAVDASQNGAKEQRKPFMTENYINAQLKLRPKPLTM